MGDEEEPAVRISPSPPGDGGAAERTGVIVDDELAGRRHLSTYVRPAPLLVTYAGPYPVVGRYSGDSDSTEDLIPVQGPTVHGRYPERKIGEKG
jgi:hypothetical protein